MLRLIPITLIWVILSVGYCHGKRDEIILPSEIAAPLKTKFSACVTEVNGDTEEMLEQIYSAKIKDEEKLKRILSCFFKGDGSGAALDPKVVINSLGDFDKKSDVLKVMDDCSRKSDKYEKTEKTFSFVQCFMKNSPVLIKLD